VDAHTLADRAAAALKSIAGCDRELVRTSLVTLQDRFRTSNSDIQYRALVRLGHEDFFWDMTDQALDAHLNVFIAAATDHAALTLAGSDIARHHLPALATRIAQLSEIDQIAVFRTRPSKWFIQPITELLANSGNYRHAEEVGRVLLEHAKFLTLSDLNAALGVWAQTGSAFLPAICLLQRWNYSEPRLASESSDSRRLMSFGARESASI
jgi:hypothetical protein